MQAALDNGDKYRIPPESGRKSITATLTAGAARWTPFPEAAYSGSEGTELVTDIAFATGDDWGGNGWTIATGYASFGPARRSSTRAISAPGMVQRFYPDSLDAALSGNASGAKRVLVSVTVDTIAGAAGVFRFQYGDAFMDFPGNVPGLYQAVLPIQESDIAIFPLGDEIACTKLLAVSMTKITAEIGIPLASGVPQTLPPDAYISAGADDTVIAWVSNF